MSQLLRTVASLGTLLSVLAVAPLRADHWRRSLVIEGGLPVVDVWIGRAGPYRFAVDTGAEGTTVSREMARRLALPGLGGLEQHTLTGVAKVPLVQVAALTLGRDGPVRNVAAGVGDLAAMRQVAPGIDGVLGGDVLNGLDYVLDYEASRLTVLGGDAGETPGRGGVSLPLRFERHRPIVDWPVSAGPGASIPLVLDTGASALVIDEREATRFPCLAAPQAVILETHTGRRAVRSCRAEPLRAGSIAVAGLQLVATPWPLAIERLDRGLLPASAFARIQISARRGALTVWPR